MPSIIDYHMVNRTYRYSTADPLYPFGYGLSYSSFSYVGANMDPKQEMEPTCKSSCTLSVQVKNTGPYDADEVSTVASSIRDNMKIPGKFPIFTMIRYLDLVTLSPIHHCKQFKTIPAIL